MTGFLSIPAEEADATWIDGAPGQRLRLYRMRAGRRDGPPLLLGHCNGFAAGAYLPILRELAREADVFAYDHRGHGGSEPPAQASLGADDLARDAAAAIEAVAAARPGRRVAPVGHSLSAASILRLATAMPGRYRDLPIAWQVLVEPPVFPGQEHPLFAECTRRTDDLLARTRRRRRAWRSAQDYADALRGRGPFAAFAPGMLESVARATLRPAADGLELACAPETEATIFALWGQPILFPRLGEVPDKHPTCLVGGDPSPWPHCDWVTMMMAPSAARMPWMGFRTMAGRGHLWPFEAPGEFSAFLGEKLRRPDA
ncbi:MAG: alpha/beta hydrolase [Alphaproteobacteria bacterium]